MCAGALKKRIGDILVDVGLITKEQLNEAVSIQSSKGGKLGAILAQMGAVNEEVMLGFLGKQCGISFISLSEYGDIPAEALRALPENLNRHHVLIPIAKAGNQLTIAMADPFNINAIDDIKLLTGFDTKIVISSEAEITDAIEQWYSRSQPLETCIDQSMHDDRSNSDHEPPAKRILNFFLADFEKLSPSEIYFEPYSKGARVRYRICGNLSERFTMQHESDAALGLHLKSLMKLPQKMIPQEGILQAGQEGQTKSFQISFSPTDSAERIVIKSMNIKPELLEMMNLGLEQDALSVFLEGIEPRPGIVIIAGNERSGRTTTLSAALSHLVHSGRDIVCVTTDPRIVPGVTQALVRPLEGVTSAALVDAYMRQNPDVLACDGINDPQTAKLLFQAALTGRFVIAVMHAADSLDALNRLRGFGVLPSIIASTLIMMVHQRVLRTVCDHCRTVYEVPQELLTRGEFTISLGAGPVTFTRGQGCKLCHYSGCGGLAGIFELYVPTPQFRDCISKNAELVPNCLEGTGLILLEQLWKKTRAGIASAEEFLLHKRSYARN